jgi:hypothetical protein
LRDSLKAAFEGGQYIPEHLSVPDERMYSYMIHSYSKTYGISKQEAGSYTEYDFWEMLAYENLDNKKEEYLLKQKSE